VSHEPSIVGMGIDTLKINVKLLDADGAVAKEQALPEKNLERLRLWQEQAKEQNKPMKTSLSMHKARLLMYPNGAPSWKYILRNDCIELKLVPRLRLPMIGKVTFLSSYLWEMGDVRKAIKEVRGFLARMFGEAHDLQISEIDLCVDVVGLDIPQDWERVFLSLAKVKREISETQKDAMYYRGRKIETLLFSGHGRPVNAKIYNKLAEIKQHREEKAWFYPIWQRRQWDGKQVVHRVEFAVEREGLNQMGFSGVDETIHNITRIWDYCTHEWLRMVEPGRTRNRARWATHPVWKLLQHAFDDYGNEEVAGLGPLVRTRRREKNIEQAVAAFAGYSTTYAAWEELVLNDDTCEPELFALIFEKVQERWRKRKVSLVDVIREKKFLYSQVP
jgi:hypothetical protein